MATFSERIKELRTQKNLSQRELADRLNLAFSTVGMYESGKRNPPVETMEIIADYFNVSLDYLSGKDDLTVRLIDTSELKLLDAYRLANPIIQEAVCKLLDIAE